MRRSAIICTIAKRLTVTWPSDTRAEDVRQRVESQQGDLAELRSRLSRGATAEDRYMLQLLADVNFNGDIVRGLLLRQPDFAIVRAQDVGLDREEDPSVLAWAAENERIVVTHDRATMPDFAYNRVAQGPANARCFRRP